MNPAEPGDLDTIIADYIRAAAQRHDDSNEGKFLFRLGQYTRHRRGRA